MLDMVMKSELMASPPVSALTMSTCREGGAAP